MSRSLDTGRGGSGLPCTSGLRLYSFRVNPFSRAQDLMALNRWIFWLMDFLFLKNLEFGRMKSLETQKSRWAQILVGISTGDLVEHVTASEVEDSTVVLIVRDDSDVKSSVKMIIRQATHSHELGVSLTCVGFCWHSSPRLRAPSEPYRSQHCDYLHSWGLSCPSEQEITISRNMSISESTSNQNNNNNRNWVEWSACETFLLNRKVKTTISYNYLPLLTNKININSKSRKKKKYEKIMKITEYFFFLW